MERLRIGQLAQATDVPVATLRYYEKRQLLSPPRRSAGGYRLYPADTVKDVRFIRRAKRLGFSLNEISDLLALRAADDDVCARTRDRANATIERIDARIGDLRRMRDDLSALAGSCADTVLEDDCPIMDSLGDVDGANG
jgi:MerR family copper efflux transcriptional regulator